jgi:hypothetical protein
MKPLRASTIMILGTAASGVVFAMVRSQCSGVATTAMDIVAAFGSGVAVGFAVFGMAGMFLFARERLGSIPLSRKRKVVFISVLTAALVLVVLSALFRQRPLGKFASYKMMLHDTGDVLRFTNGMVSWETCCGQQFVGNYEKSQHGEWIWHMRLSMGKKKPPLTNDYILGPGLIWLTCKDASAPTNNWRLRRSLFTWPD